MRPALRVVLGAALLPLCQSRADAHGIDCDVIPLPDGRLRIEVYYTDGTAAGGAEVVVRGHGGVELARGTADASGVLEVAVPPGAARAVEVRHGSHFRPRALPAGGGEVRGSRGAIPWGRLLAGLAVIAAVSLGLNWLLARRRPS